MRAMCPRAVELSLSVWVVVLALVCAAGVRGVEMDADMAELARMVRESCAAETGADVALVERVNAGADLMPDDKLKCYIKCTMETAGMMSDGDVDVDAVLALLPPELAARNGPALHQCGTRRGADHCDTAYLTQLCWQTANKADYFLI